jgi:Fe-S-cluster-containing dehydrogenase component
MIQKLATTVEATKKDIEALESVKAYREMYWDMKELRASHKTCPGCGMCFGGHHLAVPFKHYKDIGYVCEWCADSIKKEGITAFNKRRKEGKK